MKKLKKGMKFVKPCLHLFALLCLLGQMSHAITDDTLPEGHVQDEELSPGTHGVEFNMTELANMEFLLQIITIYLQIQPQEP